MYLTHVKLGRLVPLHVLFGGYVSWSIFENRNGKIAIVQKRFYTDYIQPMIAEKYRSLSRWTRKMSELWLVNELDEKCSKQERLLIIIWILWFQVWHKYRNNNILTSLREWLIFTLRDCLFTNTYRLKRTAKSEKPEIKGVPLLGASRAPRDGSPHF